MADIVLIGSFLFMFSKCICWLYQGEVEQISHMMKVVLEYLKDIIGTNKYVEKTDKSCKE